MWFLGSDTLEFNLASLQYQTPDVLHQANQLQKPIHN